MFIISLTSAPDGSEWSTPRPSRIMPGNDPVLNLQGVGYNPGPDWTGAENSPRQDLIPEPSSQ
jgi:hypothetical protein